MELQQPLSLRRRRVVALALRLSFVIVLPVAFLILLLARLSAPCARADAEIWYVSPLGDDDNSCHSDDAPCRTLQAALDQASGNATINVAQGVYTDDAGTVARIVRDVTLRGGWDLSFTVQDPATYSTVLDAQWGGPVVVIRGPTVFDPISPRVEGFVLTHGNGTGVAGCAPPGDVGCGGGVFGTNATPYIVNNRIYNNVAAVRGEGFGGGIHLQGEFSGGIIQGNTIVSNVAAISSTAFISGWGGGICLYDIVVEIYDNHIQDNVASATLGWGYGGGVVLYRSASRVISNVIADNIATTTALGDLSGWGGGVSVVQTGGEQVSIVANEIRANIASLTGHGWGGGIQIGNSNVWVSENQIVSNVSGMSLDRGDGGGIYGRYGAWTIQDNVIMSNTAATLGMAFGGGCQLEHGEVILERNLIAGNTAARGTRNGLGGGVNMLRCHGSVVRNNIFRANVASLGGIGYGGGLSVRYGPVWVDGNYILDNHATLEGVLNSWGGGVRIDSATPVTLTNNVIAHNQAQTEGGGVHVFGNVAGTPSHAILIHNTLVENTTGSAGEGVYVAQYASVSATNNILVSHTVGIFCKTGWTVVLTDCAVARYNLLRGNAVTDTLGPVTANHTITGRPHFVDPAAGDFHIQLASAALDSGVHTFVSHDIDQGERPVGDAPDVGADEISLPDLSASEKRVDRDKARPGERATYTLTVKNDGDRADVFVITDTLDAHTTFSGFVGGAGHYGYAQGVITWTGTVSRQAQVELVFRAVVEAGAVGAVTNTARFQDGMGNVFTDTALTRFIALSSTKQVEPRGQVFAGATLTYAVGMHNRGGGVIQVQLSDTLPAHTLYVTDSVRVFPSTPTLDLPRRVGGALVWEGAVTPGGHVTVAFSVQVEPGTAAGTTITNVARLYDPGVDTVTRVSVTNTVRAPLISAAKRSATAGGAAIRPGGVLSYSVVVTNLTGGVARLWVTDAVPLHTRYLSGSVGWEGDGAPCGSTLAGLESSLLSWACDLGPRQVLTLSFAVTVHPDVSIGASIANVAWIDELSDPAVAFSVQTLDVVGHRLFLPLVLRVR